MIEVKEQCKSCFHFQVCANVLKQQLYIREKMLNEENPKCEHYTPTADVVEVKHGYWKDTEYGTCSFCDRSVSDIYDADSSMTTGILPELIACPFCGAKMSGKT